LIPDRFELCRRVFKSEEDTSFHGKSQKCCKWAVSKIRRVETEESLQPDHYNTDRSKIEVAYLVDLS
jgi:hypothetical protein